MDNRIFFGLEEKPPLVTSLFVALQHMLAVFGGIVAAPLIMASGMGLGFEDTSYLVSSSLVISGLSTLLQISRFGPLGSGLLSIQGTSFTFIGPIISAYFMLVEGRSSAEALGIIFGTSALCALCVGLLFQFVEKVQTVVTANVTGTTVILIGMSLVWATLKNLHGEFDGIVASGGNPWVIVVLACFVFFLTLFISRHKHPFMRMLSVTLGLLLGSVFAYFLGLVDVGELTGVRTVFVPQFNRFPLAIDFSLFFVLLPIFVISSIETIGDLTATCKLSGLTLGSKNYWGRIRGGVCGDAFNSFFATLLCSFPNTSFSQNNGVIRLTGVCSRHVGRFTAVMLCILGFFPIIGGLLIIIPGAVLYGATMLMFLMVLSSGVAIIQGHSGRDKHCWWVAGIAIVVGWLCAILVPHANFLPNSIKSIFSFPISTGAMIAVLVEMVRKMNAGWIAEPEVS